MKYIEFEPFKKFGYIALQTTKDAKNMKEKENLLSILKTCELNDKYVCGKQTHSTNIACIYKNKKYTENLSEIDGYISNDTSYTLVTYYADCLPIFLLDPIKNVFGVLHGGWRGSANKILEKAIKLMVENYSCNISNILVCFGIGVSCKNYEIKEDTVQKLKTLLDFNNMVVYRDGKIYLDNMLMNKQIALNSGILEENIFENNYCTFEGNFYSYRKNKTENRMAAIISKKKGDKC